MLLKRYISVLFLLISYFSFAESKIITFPILGFRTVPTTPIPLEVEWNESWFGEKSAFEYHHKIARIACVFAEVSYVEDVISNPKGNVIYQCYKALDVEDENMLFYYDIDYTTELGNDQSGVIFAHRQIESSKGNRTLVFVVLRGTPRNSNEWISNANISDSTKTKMKKHEGFYISADQVYKQLVDYVQQHNIDKKESFLLVTGHSRGASVANMLAALIENRKEFDTKNVYAYTFGTPCVTTEDDYDSEKYGFIWNIENPEDVCANVPGDRAGWSYKRYGHTKALINNWAVDSQTYENEYIPRMEKYLYRFIERSYTPFRIGPFFSSQAVRTFTTLNPDVPSYYKPITGFKKKFDFVFCLMFPEKPRQKKPVTKKNTKSGFGKILNIATSGLYDYTYKAVFDMHQCESYLSWMMALDDDELFTTEKSSQIVMKGSFNAIVTDETGKKCAEIENGIVKYKELHLPVSAVTFPGKTIIGFPGNRVFNVNVYQNSLIPTPLSLQIEHFNEAGTLTQICDKTYLSPHIGTEYSFSAGKYTKLENIVSTQKVHRIEKPSFMFSPQLSIGKNLSAEVGLNIGTAPFYATGLISKDYYAFGFGSEQNLFYRIMTDEAVYYKNCFENDFDDYLLSLKLSVGYKMYHRLQFFVSGVIDFDKNKTYSDYDIQAGFRF